MSNTARDVIEPSESGCFRVVFLYVGQGAATLLVCTYREEDWKFYKGLRDSKP